MIDGCKVLGKFCFCGFKLSFDAAQFSLEHDNPLLELGLYFAGIFLDRLALAFESDEFGL